MHGFLVVDKPEGITSHDVVARVRKLVGIRQVGHTGTLDPFATGVLVVACGAATKAIPYLAEEMKSYAAFMHLGVSTDTQDRTGTILYSRPYTTVAEELCRTIAATFVGKLSQIPPMYSALKQGGVPLYRLARNGQEVPRAPRQIEIHALSITRFAPPEVEIAVDCSKGTYVRTLVHDLGEALGCGAHVQELRRTASGPFHIDQAVSLAALQTMAGEGRPMPFVGLNAALGHLPSVSLTFGAAQKVLNGLLSSEVHAALQGQVGIVRLLAPAGELLALVASPYGNDPTTGRLLRVFPELYSLQG